MNNCPKCGNPLQVGVSTCPICGTNIEQNLSVSENKTAEVMVNSVANPMSQNVTVPVPQPVTEAPAEAPAAPVEVATPTPVAQVAPVAPTTPVVETPVPEVTPVASVTQTPQVEVTPTKEVKEHTKTRKKVSFKINKNVLVILGLLIIVAVVGVFGFKFLNKPIENPNDKNKNTSEIASVISNGYRFNIDKNWSVNEDGQNVILSNESDSLFIRFTHSNSNISSINKSMIEQYLDRNSAYKEKTVVETKISAKDAYLINCRFNDLPVQIYFINGGSNLLLGVTIIYQSEDTKSKYESVVTELVGSTSYADESSKAISVLNMYSNIFGVFDGILNFTPPTTPEPTPDPIPVPENPTEEVQTPPETNPETPTENPENE